jgi:thiamine-phosphate pyrophosphorylase
MASRGNSAQPRRLAPRLYLIAPQDFDPLGLVVLLAQAFMAADIAAVLLRNRVPDERTRVDRAKALAQPVQERGAALLLDGDPDLVARAGADGSHLTGFDALKPALATLKPDRIAGCGGLGTRHNAMLAAEAGADYVMFGDPDQGGARPSLAAITDRLSWWAEIFEVPCVGFAASLDEVGPLAAAGADFVALGGCVFSDARGCTAALADAAQRLRVAEHAT